MSKDTIDLLNEIDERTILQKEQKVRKLLVTLRGDYKTIKQFGLLNVKLVLDKKNKERYDITFAFYNTFDNLKTRKLFSKIYNFIKDSNIPLRILTFSYLHDTTGGPKNA